MMGGEDACANSHCDVQADRHDYERFQAEYGFRSEEIRPIFENTSDQVPMPPGFNKLELRPSPIAGQGCFAVEDVAAGEVIAPARVNGCRTPAGRYTNHSCTPTCEYHVLPGGDALMYAIGAIPAGGEFTVNYRRVGGILGNRPILAEAAITLGERLCKDRGPDWTREQIEALAAALVAKFGYLPSPHQIMWPPAVEAMEAP